MAWKPIPEFTRYEVSDDGRVRTAHGRVLKDADCHGYRKVVLTGDNGRRYNRNIHVLVALTFIGPRPEGMQICHFDGDRTNNTPANLRYGSATENSADKRRHGTHNGWRRSHCKRGHELVEGNLIHRKDGQRECSACRKAKQPEYDRRHYAKVKAQAAEAASR